MKIFLTGGAGFIGSHIAESLLGMGHEVKIYDNFSTGNEDNFSAIKNVCEIIRGDILEYDKLKRAMSGSDLVSHQAAQLEILRGDNNPKFDLEINTIGTLNVLRAAKENGVKKMVNASSACIYGQTDVATTETYYPRPNWAYGVSKLAAEKYCEIYNDYQDLPIVNLRYAITYGEREWYRRVLTIFIKRAVQDLPLIIFGNGKQVRDFVYVGDVVKFHNLCLFENKANGETFNVGTGIPVTIEELANNVMSASGKDLKIVYEDTPEGEVSKLVEGKKRNSSELKRMLLDVTKAEYVLGWKPETSLLDGLKKEYHWASKNLKRWEKIYYSK